MTEKDERFYMACSDLWKQRASLAKSHRTEDICTLATEYLEYFYKAAPLCFVEMTDLESAGESDNMFHRPLRRVRLQFKEIK